MTQTVTHRYISQIPPTDDANLVSTLNWNDTHVIVGTIDPSQITPIAANTLLANPTGSVAAPIATILGSTLAFVGGSSLQTLAGSGDVAWAANSFVTTIQPNVVSNSKFRQSAALSVVGNPTNATANVQDIIGTADQVLVVNHAGNAMGFGQVNLTASAGVTGVLPVVNGGTGLATLTANAVLLGEGTSNVGFATTGTGGRLLIDQGAGVNPAFTAMSQDALITAGGVLTIQPNVVSYSKIQQVTASRLLGNPTGSLANVSEISLTSALAFSGTSLDIATSGVTYAKIQLEAATTLLGNPTGAPSHPSEITLGATLAFVSTALQTLAITGDVTSSANSFATTVVKVNGVSYPSGPSTNTVPVVTGTNTVTYETVPVAAGGTGQTTLTNHGVLIGAGTAAITQLGVGASGTVLVGNAGADPSFSNTPQLGVANSVQGNLAMAHSANSGILTLAPASSATTWTLRFPGSAGSNLQVLQTDGAGNTSWTNAGTGTITGPGSSTNAAIVRWNGTTGLVIENSVVTIDGSGNAAGYAAISMSGALATVTNLTITGSIATATTITASSTISTSGVFQGGNGSAASPTLSWNAIPSSGWYNSGGHATLSTSNQLCMQFELGAIGAESNSTIYYPNSPYFLDHTASGLASGIFGSIKWHNGNNTVCGAITVDAGAHTTTYATSSDITLKDVTGPIESGPSFDGITPFMFKWKIRPEMDPIPGFSAQEVLPYQPQAIVHPDSGVVDHLMMDAGKLIPCMWAEIKALRARVKTLEGAK